MLVHHDVLGEPAGAGEAEEVERGAVIRPFLATPPARPAARERPSRDGRPGSPAAVHAGAGVLDPPRELVAQDRARRADGGGDVQVAPADPTSTHAQDDLARSGR